MVTVKKKVFSLQSSGTDDFWSNFHSLQNLIQEESENIGFSDKFSLILGELEQLHQLATTARQQVIDAQWNEIGKDVCDLLYHVSLCSITMVAEPKKTVSKKQDLDGDAIVEKTETIKNIATMFEVLKARKKSVKFENFIFNRISFAQPAENLFRKLKAEIKGDDDHRVVSLRNAPNSNLIKCGDYASLHTCVWLQGLQK
ncbi:hypothetical protein MKW92_004414 [Papaver armeniacum]|nr:hypothetical protein MKW92_004414 [Papaver armeniacum]